MEFRTNAILAHFKTHCFDLQNLLFRGSKPIVLKRKTNGFKN
ncbi:hypothetical protein HMPREF9296_1430 [Prevotella disiens FB035-09AN]|uniref:Uncharacterized protein n=1 Tax=Prevotella disiens FB035-09AN TaxID=866771 RepID=E1KRX1_9BACT|nr:hypothetical protein HMPREF9296_1430 [Prevotella disiens FB035-09AN]